MPVDKIEVLVHSQSVVHSMVEYKDGSILAQLGAADMCTPITYALAYPERLETSGQKLDFKTLKTLDFEAVDKERFPFVQMAYDAVAQGAGACVAMNAANEVAVEAFLSETISFLDIHKIVVKMMEKSHNKALESLNDVLEYDMVIRLETKSLLPLMQTEIIEKIKRA
jgi:1-deoxy-D-xylulose-5-phosphate reductoisomerase